jgi:hypothetical protein
MKTPKTRDRPFSVEEVLLNHIKESSDFKALVNRIESENIDPKEVDVKYLMKPPKDEYRIIKGTDGTITREPKYGWGSVKVGKRENTDNDLPFEHTVEAGVKVHRRSGDA